MSKLLSLAFMVFAGIGLGAVLGSTVAHIYFVLLGVAVAFKVLPVRWTFGVLSLIFVWQLILPVLVGMGVWNYLAGETFVSALWGAAAGFYGFLALAPHRWVRALMKPPIVAFLRLFFSFEARGLENYKVAGERRLLCPTHPSFLDPLFIIASVDEKITFAAHSGTVDAPVMKFLIRFGKPFADIYKVDMFNAMALKKMVSEVKKGRTICIFPEGRLQFTGGLMKVQNGPTVVVNNADAVIVPVHVNGLQYSLANRMAGKLRRHAFPRVTVTFTSHVQLQKKTGRAAREDIQLYDAMRNTVFSTAGWRGQTIYESLRDSASLHSLDHTVLENIDPVTEQMVSITYKEVLIGATVLSRKLKPYVTLGENVGLMLPNAVGTAVAFFAMQRMGVVPAMLNFTMGPKSVLACADAAQLKTVFTSRQFLELAASKNNMTPQHIITALEESGRQIIYLDDVRKSVTQVDKIKGLLTYENWKSKRKADDPAVVLFTSGSEGVPKGVVLSHANLLANKAQMKSMVGFTHQDVVLNAMPLFHSFGLLAGMILPVMEGVKTFMYPNPLDYKLIPMIAYDIGATIMFGTDAFLQGYARQAHAFDFTTMRAIFAGAEKVKDETRAIYSGRLSTIIYEGYGATECAPVIAVNTPMYNKPGTVGRPVSGLVYRLEDVPGIDDGGRLFVKGDNVMLGYLKHDKPGVLQTVEDGWYDTGDIVRVDEQGFITIIGRAKRFAKVAGEMVALPVVDDLAAKAWPDFNHASVAMDDERKGQKIVLLTENPNADKATLQELAKKDGISALAVPADIRVVKSIPLLGSGKVDFGALNELLDEIIES